MMNSNVAAVDVSVRLLQLIIIIGLVLLPLAAMASPLSFSFSSFSPGKPLDIFYQGDAQPTSDGVIELTKNVLDKSIKRRRGWAVYSRPVPLWDVATGNLTNFTTTFSFVVDPLDSTYHGDGLAFFLAPSGTTMPRGTFGGTLALFRDGPNSSATPPSRRIVAVEFDTFQNPWDPQGVHVGIDVGSIVSVEQASWASSLDQADRAPVNATVTYDAGAMQLSARFSGGNGAISRLTAVVDLRRELPPWVTIGFSASTGSSVELHKIRSWSFNSTLEQVISDQPRPPAGDVLQAAPAPAPSSTSVRLPPDKKHRGWIALLAGLMAGIGLLAAVSGAVWRRRWRRNATRWRGQGSGVELGVIIDDSEINEGKGPKRFTNREIARATKNFAPDRRLGRGGFGEVYRGFLNDLGLEVAVKRVASDSMQGKKEYLAEINIISRLRHRNLVRLVGWCHDRGDLHLVYEYLPNSSLDAHLFGGGGGVKAPLLTWRMRYKIAQGLASALLYLHEGFEQCVVHRDVKSSNVMLDADFNAKLGDFGLARLVDHGLGMQTTVPAGTWGYLAPECAIGGKASKESDVYSFGVVALEIACGRKPIDQMAEEAGNVSLVAWVWGLYGRHALLDAADERVRSSSDLDVTQMERLMEVGLWCAHPDFHSRPSMRRVMSALNFETMPPSLSEQMPVLTYVPPTSSSSSSSSSWQRDMVQSSSGQSSATSTCTTAVSPAATSNTSSSTADSDGTGRPLILLSEPR